jgi:hypothetical protein
VSRGALVALTLALLFTAPDARAVEFDSGDLKLDLGASLRELVTRSREVRTDDVFPAPDGSFSLGASPSLLAQTRVRIDLQARYRERFSAQVSYDNELFLGSGRKSLAFALADARGNSTWADLDRTISDTQDATWQHLLYRGWLRYEGDDVELTIGRQRIALGRARLWNPTDLFNPIPPLAIEGDQRIGVDSVVTRVRVTNELWASAIVAPQSTSALYRSALRLELSRRSLDAALMFARIETDSVYGADFATNLGDAALRGEGTWTFHAHGGHTTQLVGSLDYTFDIGSGLYALVEHFYNGNTFSRDALGDTLDALPPLTPEQGLSLLTQPGVLPQSQLVTSSYNQTGVDLGYDLTPLVRLDVLWIHDWEGPSEAFVPVLTWSALQNLELSLGAQIFGGRDGAGNYGGLEPLYFARVDVYF